MNRAGWKRLASHVVARRVELGYRTRRALERELTGRISGRTLASLESGLRVSANTLAAVESALGWAPGSAAAILDGGSAEVITSDSEPDSPHLRDNIERQIWALDLPEWRRQALIAVYRSSDGLDQSAG